MAAGGGRETNYWPGFVDALTNTVIAMVFLVIVLTLSLSVFINAVANKRAEKIIEEQAKAKSAAAAAAPGSAGAAGAGTGAAASATAAAPAGQPSLLKGDVRIADAGKSAPTPSTARAPAQSAANALLLHFPGTTVEVDDKSELELDRIAASSGLAFAQMEALVVARGPQVFLSENQRLAFFRSMSVRNFLLKKGIARDNIKIRIEDAPGATEGTVSVSVRKAGTATSTTTGAP